MSAPNESTQPAEQRNEFREALQKIADDDLAERAARENETVVWTPANYRRLDSVKTEPISWLWPGQIARGKVSMIAGHPGLGKSQVTISMAAIVSTGGHWPAGGARCERGSIVFLSAEDDPADTIKPRLLAAGADVERVYVLDSVTALSKEQQREERSVNLKTDIARIGAVLTEIGDVALIVIDPITAYLGEADSHKNAEIRALLKPLSDLAAKHRAAIVCVSHLSKGGSNEAVLRVNGSLAFVAAARAAFMVVRDKENAERRLFVPIKNNIGKDQIGFAFILMQCSPEPGIETSRVAWSPETVTISADEAMEAAEEKARPEDDPGAQGALHDAMMFLHDELENGPLPAAEILKRAVQEGHTKITVRRAKEKLGIVLSKDGMRGGWVWRLPKLINETEDAHTKKSDHVQCR